MTKNEKTSKRVAKLASGLLKSSKSKTVKSVAASGLTQAADRNKKKRK